MGFHCGNASACLLKKPVLKGHIILERTLGEAVTKGTLEGDFKQGPVTLFRLQSNVSGQLKAYVAQGDVLDVPTHSFGSIGIIAVPEMERFYRYALIEKQFPHHAAVAFEHLGGVLYDIFKLLGITDISYNRPKNIPYPNENPFVW